MTDVVVDDGGMIRHELRIEEFHFDEEEDEDTSDDVDQVLLHVDVRVSPETDGLQCVKVVRRGSTFLLWFYPLSLEAFVTSKGTSFFGFGPLSGKQAFLNGHKCIKGSLIKWRSSALQYRLQEESK